MNLIIIIIIIIWGDAVCTSRQTNTDVRSKQLYANTMGQSVLLGIQMKAAQSILYPLVLSG